MYAENFNAPTWLEEPSQWLWWAMQSRINGNLQDAQYNLKQFWTTLDTLKQTADESTWPEILALDSQSHIQAANITSAIINQMEQDINTASAWIGIFGWKGTDAKTAIKKMQDQRLAELQTADALAAQAQTATAQRVTAVAAGRISQDQAERARENTDVNNIIKSNSSLDIAGIPIWAWIAGALALVFILNRR
jgi:alpha-amylase/alpha-mannosidase (GH57 family)